MARVMLGVTGSVAAIRTPELVSALRKAGHEMRVVVTEPALRFFDARTFDGQGLLYRDVDEWPSSGWKRGDPVPHIDFRNWADMLVIAPLDANSLGKFALGLCDNFLTCLVRAWDFEKPMILAPAMNTLMWRSPVTLRHLRMILDDHGDGAQPIAWRLDEAADVFARHAPRIVLVPPQSKRLACGDVGVGAMAEVPEVAETVRSQSSSFLIA